LNFRENQQDSRPVKPILACLLLLAPVARGQIFADVSTTMGDFTIQLDHLNSPQTVANFIRLVEGSTPWVHPDTGLVHFDTPYYNGIIFHRVIAGFMSQTGSPRGDGSDGPGYNFRDEVDNGLTNARHTVSMANSGPNTNGSQFFINDEDNSSLDGKHTVFGLISSGANVVDAINDVATTGDLPDTPVVMNTIAIRRVGAEAIAFDEHALVLPEVSAPMVTLQCGGPATSLDFSRPARSQTWCFHSTDTDSWTATERFLHADATPASSLDVTAEANGDSSHFFSTSVVNYPANAIFPASLDNRTLTATLIGDGVNSSRTVNYTGQDFGTIVFQFDNSGGGTYQYGASSGSIDSYDFSADLYGGRLLIYTGDGTEEDPGLIPLRFRFGLDTFDSAIIRGRHTGKLYFSNAFGYDPAPSRGTFTLTR